LSRYIAESLRLFVAERADFRCEYCLLPEYASFYTFHIDHIISLKHGGLTEEKNLANACPICNINKGSDVATILQDIRLSIRFYNPRIDQWADHFEAHSSGLIIPKTSIGEATIKILELNQTDSIIERSKMVKLGLI
jgi:HNH endonuclease